MWEHLFSGLKEGKYTTAIVSGSISVALWILTAIARRRVFGKMGENAWKAIIPVWGLYIMYSKCWSKNIAWSYVTAFWISVLFDIGVFQTNSRVVAIVYLVVNALVTLYILYLTVRLNFCVAKAFGHGFGYGIGLWLVPYVFFFILGVGKSEYIGVPQPKTAETH